MDINDLYASNLLNQGNYSDIIDPNLPPDVQVAMQQAKQRQRIAGLLTAKALQPIQGQMVGDIYVPPSPLQGLAQLGYAYGASGANEASDKISNAIAQQRAIKNEQGQQQFLKEFSGTPEIAGHPLPQDAQGNVTITNPVHAVPGNPDLAMSHVLANPYMSPDTKKGDEIMYRAAEREKQEKEAQAQHVADLTQIEKYRKEDQAQAAANRSADLEAGRQQALAIHNDLMANRAPPPISQSTIIDPLNPNQSIVVDARTFNADKYKNGDNTGVIGASSKLAGGQLTPEALDRAATDYRMTNTLPGGFGMASQKVAIINRAAEMAKADGQDAESQSLQKQTGQAASVALKRLESQKALVMAFSKTAVANLEQVKQISSTVDRTGIPAFNRWLLAGRKSIAGDPDVARLDAAITTAANEYAKVTSSATGGGVNSDQARAEAKSLIDRAETPQQITAVIDQMNRDVSNRANAYLSEEQDTLKSMKLPSPAQSQPPAGAPTVQDIVNELRRRGKVQ